MKKTFKINKITKQEIKEAISDAVDEISSQDIFSDSTNDFANRANRRVIKAIRTAEECERAAAIARGNGDIASAEDLERRAEDLKAWAQNRWSSKSADENEKKHIESAKDEAEKAANEAKQSAAEAERDAREAESEAEKAEKEAADSDDPSKRQEAEAKREAANEAREAADEAKEAAKDARDAADEAADAVDEEDAKEAADRAREAANKAADAADKAREAKESAKESSEKSEGSSESEESSNSEDSNSEEESGSSSKSDDAHTDSSSNSDDSSSNKSSSSSSNSDDEESDEESDGEESDESGESSDESEDEDSEDSDGESDAEDEESGDEPESGDEGEDSQSQSSNQSSKKPFKNPFDLAPRKAKSPMNQSNMKGKNDPDEEGDELDEIERMKRVLKMLRGGEKDGAIKALSDILDDKVSLSEKDDESSLVEAINSSSTIDQISDEEFDAIIDDSLKAIEKVKKLRKERSRTDNIKKIDDLKKDNLFRHNLGAEDRTNIRIDTKKDTGQSEVQRLHNLRYYASSFKPSTAFKHDLLLAIQDQISTYKEQRKSWAAINRRTAHTSIMKQGTQHITQEEPKKPSIRVYLDCSSSFRKEDIEKEENFMQSIARFEKDGDIEKTVIKYFADDLWDDYQTARDQGGTNAWDEIIEDIKKYKPSNVVIVTDYDMYSQGGQYGTAEIDGIAWFIWKKYAAQSLINDIKCKKTIQYNLI